GASSAILPARMQEVHPITVTAPGRDGDGTTNRHALVHLCLRRIPSCILKPPRLKKDLSGGAFHCMLKGSYATGQHRDDWWRDRGQRRFSRLAVQRRPHVLAPGRQNPLSKSRREGV